MSQSETSDQIAETFEPPFNTQFSVFLDNRVGKLMALLDVFSGHAVTVAGLSVVDSADHAVVRLVTSRAALTRRLLDRHGLPFSEVDILAIELRPEQDQDLKMICLMLIAAEVSIQYAYPLMVQPHGYPVIAIQTDDLVLAGQILCRKCFHLLGENDLGENATFGDPFDNRMD